MNNLEKVFSDVADKHNTSTDVVEGIYNSM